MRLNYNDMLLLAIWEYNRRQDEDLTLELFQETFGQVPGASGNIRTGSRRTFP